MAAAPSDDMPSVEGMVLEYRWQNPDDDDWSGSFIVPVAGFSAATADVERRVADPRRLHVFARIPGPSNGSRDDLEGVHLGVSVVGGGRMTKVAWDPSNLLEEGDYHWVMVKDDPDPETGQYVVDPGAARFSSFTDAQETLGDYEEMFLVIKQPGPPDDRDW